MSRSTNKRIAFLLALAARRSTPSGRRAPAPFSKGGSLNKCFAVTFVSVSSGVPLLSQEGSSVTCCRNSPCAKRMLCGLFHTC
uniref:Uncharacterized protein n=1 Tax=Nyssomyia neivai TaxID=330878 RepID=A0A1L8D8P1_9DIPT